MPEIWRRKVPIRTVRQLSSNLRNLSNLRISFSDFSLNPPRENSWQVINQVNRHRW
jgi:hypothetical protein